MKTFVVRSVNAAAVVAILLGYNSVVTHRAQAAEIARLNAELQSGAASALGSANSTESYTDGTYSGEADGFGGTVAVDVVIENGEITQVEITSAAGEDGAYLSMAKDIIPKIIEKQSAEVDTISGATFSSTGIKNATAQALEKAEK
jgi:uncharacterized protein with FMN-binding domain